MTPPIELTPVELAASRPLGSGPRRPLPDPDAMTPRQALERRLATALAEDVCVVAFSGGRDSSAVLATAVHVARREGLPLPIPAILRFPGAPEAEEREWQEIVLTHLGLREWEEVELRDELDYLGDRARRGLLRNGILWPENAHAMAVLTRLAPSATLITGLDGDGLFGDWRSADFMSLFAGRVRPHTRHLRRLLASLAPDHVRLRRRLATLPFDPLDTPWLTPEGHRLAREGWSRQLAAEPVTWPAYLRWYRDLRYLRSMEAAVDAHLADDGWRTCHPFMDGRFIAALAATGGRTGFGDRTQIMRALFGDLLPAEVVTRVGKAVFHEAFWGPGCVEWAQQWDGTGVDLDLVDPDELRRDWARGSLSTAGLLLQWTWLQAQQTDDGVDRRIEAAPVAQPSDVEHR